MTVYKIKINQIFKIVFLLYLACVFVFLAIGVAEIHALSRLVMPPSSGFGNWSFTIFNKLRPWIHVILTCLFCTGAYLGVYGQRNKFWIIICLTIFFWGYHLFDSDFLCIARIIFFVSLGVADSLSVTDRDHICYFQQIDFYTTAVFLLPAYLLNLRYALSAKKST